MGKVYVNGDKYTVPDVGNVTVINNRVFVDGKDITKPQKTSFISKIKAFLRKIQHKNTQKIEVINDERP